MPTVHVIVNDQKLFQTSSAGNFRIENLTLRVTDQVDGDHNRDVVFVYQMKTGQYAKFTYTEEDATVRINE